MESVSNLSLQKKRMGKCLHLRYWIKSIHMMETSISLSVDRKTTNFSFKSFFRDQKGHNRIDWGKCYWITYRHQNKNNFEVSTRVVEVGRIRGYGWKCRMFFLLDFLRIRMQFGFVICCTRPNKLFVRNSKVIYILTFL